MPWKDWIIAILVLFTAGWMSFDGTRAFVTGDYITPKTGEHAGQLGPWADLVKAVGIEPRSMIMKSIFVLYGLLALMALTCYLLGFSWSRGMLIAVCILGLWYLPIGTFTNLIVLLLLFLSRN